MQIAQRCKENREFLQLEFELCRRDPKHFINNWVDTFDPRVAPFHFPFRLWPFQEELVDWLTESFERKENGLIEKSRDMGATWIAAAWAVHRWLFARAFIARFGSRKEDLVDDQTMDSIFGKIRYITQRLPWFLKPALKKEHDSRLRIQNPWNKNMFVGESTNIGFGRGGRSSIVFLDEFAHVEHSEAVWASVKGNADCIIPMSSVNGKGNQFSWLRHESPIRVKTLHWTQHPFKDREWYDKQCLEMQPWQVAQELDISYEKSKHGKIYRRFDRVWHIAESPIPYKPEFEQAVSWDFGRAGAMALIWLQVSPTGVTEVWNCLELSGWDIDFFIPITFGKMPSHYRMLDKKDQFKVDACLKNIPPTYQPQFVTHYGDHAGTAKTANSTRSCKDAIRKAGFDFKSSGRQGYDWRFDCLDELLKLKHSDQTGKFSSKFIISPTAQRMIDCLNNATWDSDNIHSDSIKPKNDEFFHMVSALEFFAINRFPLTKSGGVREQRWR